jgi:DNA-binding CsgD family transcriptional regulator/tetratricopeptide (TPR) repeat protein
MVGLTRLVEQSLVVAETVTMSAMSDEVVRFRLLEPVRQYAQEQLAREPSGQGEAELVRAWHAAYYLALAERVGAELTGPEQPARLEQLDREVDNLRAALAWAAEHGGRDGAEMGLRFGLMLWRFWWSREYLSEGRGWLDTFLQAGEVDGAQARTLLRAQVLFAAGCLALPGGDYPRARALFEESLAIARELRDATWTAAALTQLGHVAREQGDYAGARALYEEGLAIRQAGGTRRGLALSHTALGHVALATGDYAGARIWLERGLALHQETRDEGEIAYAHRLLGDVALGEGDWAAADEHYAAGLTRCRRLGHHQGVVYAVEGFALVAAARAGASRPDSSGHPGGVRRAVRLLGAVAALTEQLAMRALPTRRARVRQVLAAARAGLGEEAYAAAWQAGRALSLDEAVAEAIQAANEAAPTPPVAAPALPDGLTPREVEVLRLLAAGQSNRAIADALRLSVHTVERHIANLYAKIGAHSRAEATVFALRRGLAPPEAR